MRSHISLQLRLRLYESFVVPVLTYNMDTWRLTKTDWMPTTDAIYGRSSPSTGLTKSQIKRYATVADAIPSARLSKPQDAIVWTCATFTARYTRPTCNRQLFRRHWRQRFQKPTAYDVTDDAQCRPTTQSDTRCGSLPTSPLCGR